MSAGRRLLITGASGFLGSVLLHRAVAEGWAVAGTCFSHPGDESAPAPLHRLDLRDTASVAALIGNFQPEVVIHTAYSQNDRAVTFGGTLALAEVCRGLDSPPHFIQVSTDLVFDGQKGNYSEQDEPCPLMAYGRDKLDAELAVRRTMPKALIVRAALIYDLERLPVHLKFASGAIARGETFTFFEDEYRSPVLAGELAGALLAMAGRGTVGLLHVGGADRVDRWWFGLRLMRALGLPTDLARPGSSRSLSQPRPADCSLDSSRAGALLGVRFRGAREVFAGCNPELEA